MPAAARRRLTCAGILRDLFAREGRAADDFHYVSSPLGRASETMEIVRKGPRPAAGRLCARPAAAGDRLRRLGGTDLSRRPRARQGRRRAARASRSGCSGRPAARPTRRSRSASAPGTRASTRDTVVTAHGGTGRALVAYLGIAAAGRRRAPADRAGLRVCVREQCDGAVRVAWTSAAHGSSR